MLQAASFRVTQKEEEGTRACYSFCMCPGGRVIVCASTPQQITTNGMSYSKRKEEFANAAFLVPVRPSDIPTAGNSGPSILDNFKYQELIEEKAFILGGEDFSIPASRLSDFIAGKKPNDLPRKRSCKRAVPVDLRKILPDFVLKTLRSAIPKMLKKLPGVSLKEVLLYGPETRSSSPIRVVRSQEGHSSGVIGLFPAGEGAGYAGGIVSSAIDGLRTGESVVEYLQNIQ